jgi:Holliday junction resolvasome RuvABC endonuclease subunit
MIARNKPEIFHGLPAPHDATRCLNVAAVARIQEDETRAAWSPPPRQASVVMSLRDFKLGEDLVRGIARQLDGGVLVTQFPQFRRAADLPVCAVCGCTPLRGCLSGCSWVHGVGPCVSLCSQCAARKTIRLVSFDSSITRLGWSVLEPSSERVLRAVAVGFWAPSESKAAPPRFTQLARFVEQLCWMFQPTDAVAELPGKGQRFAKKGKKRSHDSLMSLARAAGTILGKAEAFARIWTADPATWKPGGVRKAATAAKMAALTGMDLQAGDESDALGLGAWWMARVYPILVGQMPPASLPVGVSR